MYPRQCRARSAAAVASTGFATQRQTAKLTLSQLINRLSPPNARRCGIVPSAADLAAASRPHPQTPRNATEFVTRYFAGDTAIT